MRINVGILGALVACALATPSLAHATEPRASVHVRVRHEAGRSGILERHLAEVLCGIPCEVDVAPGTLLRARADGQAATYLVPFVVDDGDIELVFKPPAYPLVALGVVATSVGASAVVVGGFLCLAGCAADTSNNGFFGGRGLRDIGYGGAVAAGIGAGFLIAGIALLAAAPRTRLERQARSDSPMALSVTPAGIGIRF